MGEFHTLGCYRHNYHTVTPQQVEMQATEVPEPPEGFIPITYLATGVTFDTQYILEALEIAPDELIPYIPYIQQYLSQIENSTVGGQINTVTHHEVSLGLILALSTTFNLTVQGVPL